LSAPVQLEAGSGALENAEQPKLLGVGGVVSGIGRLRVNADTEYQGKKEKKADKSRLHLQLPFEGFSVKITIDGK
jgi:hypothetical protein